MTNKKTTKPKIDVNCLTSHDKSLVSGAFRLKLTNLLDKAKASDHWKNYPEVCHETSFMKGRRYNDTDRCVNVILGSFRQACEMVVNDNNNNEFSFGHYEEFAAEYDFYFVSYLEQVNAEDLTQWVDSCLKYSGGCDHWYTYEKEW